MDRLLVVDDESGIRETLGKLLAHAGYEVDTANTGEASLEMAKKTTYSVAIVDLNLPGISGIETIKQLKKIDPDLEAIVYTGYPSLESSLDAIHENAFDYILKPADRKTLERVVEHAVERRWLITQNRDLMRQLQTERNNLKKEVHAARKVIERRLKDTRALVGKSEAIRQVKYSIAQVANSDMTVLVLGESGTGKEVVARLIHESSDRMHNAFVKINCPAIPDTLLESELFGHEPGAFTGAVKRKPGRFELASGGTIFLDEIGDLSMSLQAKLLEVIEQKHFSRLGGNQTIEVDVRVIAATNAPIEEMVTQGSFRVDVYYRLNEYCIVIPPLRHRTDDIPFLVEHFLGLYGNTYDNPRLEISPATMSLLIQHKWPGNVRELESVIQRFVLDGDENSILERLKESDIKEIPTGVSEMIRKTEIRTITAALTETKWNQRKAAELLGISYSSLRRRVAKYKLK